MKKQIIALCIATMAASATKAQETYFATGFDDGIPSEFTLHDGDGRTPSTDMQKLGFAVGTPWITVDEGKDGNKTACSTSWYKNAGQSDDWMVTAAIKVESAQAALKWRARASDKEYRDGYKVYVSETGTAVTDFDKSAPLFASPKENYDWTEHEVSLAEYEGKTIYIAFVNDSKDKTCLYVDDIFVGVPSTVGMSLNLNRVINSYGDITVSGQAFTTGDKDVTGYTIGYSVGGNKHEKTFNGVLTVGQKVDFALDDKLHIDRNQTLDYTAWIKSGADSMGITGRVSAYPWRLVSEEVTGTWCGFCVRGIVGMKTMKEKYPDSFIGIAIHNSSPTWTDAMAAGVEDYHDALYSSCKILGYPHCVFNRNAMFSIDPGEMENYYKMITSQFTNNSGIQVSATYDAATNKVKTLADVYFAADVENADYKLAYVIIENNVHRTHADLGLPEKTNSGYDQNNNYAGGGNGEMGGFENLPQTVPAEQMWYNEVARGIFPDYNGVDGIIPSTVAEDDHYTHNYEMTMPTNVLDKSNTELIVLLLDKNGTIVNADITKIAGTPTGITTVSSDATTDADDAYYTLSGVRVANPTKGIFIHGGKKVVR